MRGDRAAPEPPSNISDPELWRRSVVTEAVEDEAEHYLDLAGFADGMLDADERERVAERLAGDPDAAADVAAARALTGDARHEATPETVIARARTLVDDNVIRFRPRARVEVMARWAAQWASLAAAVVVAGWLGFTLGMDASGALTQNGAAEDGFLDELIDSPAGLLRDLAEGRQT